MKTIYKYIIRHDRLKIQMPKGARLLTAREQANEICVLAEVDTEEPTKQRHFQVFGTGHPMHEGMDTSREYVGTAHLEGGALVFHVYEYTGI
jgi:hypothetical protein